MQMEKKPPTGDESLDSHIDEMIEQWEKSGHNYDQCTKAMQAALDSAKEPLTIAQWVEASKYDRAGRRKYADTLFEPEAVKVVVLDLIKKKQAFRLGRQTFCSHVIVGEMEDAIDNVMMWEAAICNMEDLAELLADYGDRQHPDPTNIRFSKGKPISPKINKKIKNFVEEQIVTKAMDQMESLVIVGGGEFIHYTTLETCWHYAQEALAGRWQWARTPMTKNEFFEFITRVNFTGIDNQYEGRSIKRIKECLEHDAVREYVLQALEKDQTVTIRDDRVTQYKKPDKYLWLDD